MKFLPLELSTCTLSTRHSPTPCNNTCSSSAATVPLSILPVAEMIVHGALLLSSLSAQFGASELSARGSINSMLLPPACYQLPLRHPEPYASSLTVMRSYLVCST